MIILEIILTKNKIYITLIKYNVKHDSTTA